MARTSSEMSATVHELRSAAHAQAERGLRCSTKFITELLVSIAGDRVAAANDIYMQNLNTEDEDERDCVLLAKTYFDTNEFQRAAQTLRGATGQCGKFLRWYSFFLAGEKRKEEEMLEEASAVVAPVVAPSAKPRVINHHLVQLEAELKPASDTGKLDGYGHYVHALVLRELQRPTEATAALACSVRAAPCLWCAWVELAKLNAHGDTLAAEARLPQHWMLVFFRAHVALEAQHNQEAVGRYKELLGTFPHSGYVKSQLAMAHYNLRDFDMAQQGFEELRVLEPYRLEHVDTFSNILYVKESKRELSSLAHACVQVDKYRPETCCVIGNYYSLKGEHERAVSYFRRALKLNQQFLSAWTLMGHEYVELKNTAAAVDAYRHAVDIDVKDYRAWYGLGQTYEILAMPYYALFYYRKATALRPYDSRMWCAMAGCYKQLGKKPEAIKCYQRAELNNDREGIALTELARLFREENDRDQAAKYFREMLKLRELQEVSGETQEALLFLAYYCKDTGKLKEAQQHCSRLLDIGGQERDEAKALLRDIRSQATHGATDSSGY